jgi:5-oxoprolinase (ATP-hydrolysing)
MRKWQFFADRGGTFTDLVAISPDHQIIIDKLLSENPERYQDPVIQGIRNILKLTKNDPIPTPEIEVIKMGTTVATNALLERKGEPVVLLITKGFKDALRIGYQNRPNIFARQIILPSMLYQTVIEVEERYDINGQELIPLNLTQIKTDLQRVYQIGISSCAIVFMHSYRYPEHENKVAKIAQKIGFTQISVSHQISSLFKLVARGDTTVVDAYLSPILRRYVDQVSNQLPGVKIMFMKSDGGLISADQFQGKDSILSGPAGGVVGAIQTSLRANFQQIITFDMGGTSTDVAHFNGEYERQFETEIAGVRMISPMMTINTVAAGGGSILSYQNGRFQVGPESAGANPGPACYRKGGPLTVTDANVMLGKIHPQYFPHIFGIEGNLSLDMQIVKQKFRQLAAQIFKVTGQKNTPEQIAAGFLKIAVENMANAIKKVSLQRGYDVTNYTLTSFGAAGGQVCCLIADTLGIKTIFLHPYAGVLSAYGMGLADIRVIQETAVEKPLTQSLIPQLQQLIKSLEIKGRKQINSSEGIKGEKILSKMSLKYQGTDSTLLVNLVDNVTTIRAEFEKEHQSRYGFIQPQKSLIVESISVEIIALIDSPQEQFITRNRLLNEVVQPVEIVPMFTHNCWQNTPIFIRENLQPEDLIIGPAIIIEKISTIIVEPNWKATLTKQNHLILQRD